MDFNGDRGGGGKDAFAHRVGHRHDEGQVWARGVQARQDLGENRHHVADFGGAASRQDQQHGIAGAQADRLAKRQRISARHIGMQGRVADDDRLQAVLLEEGRVHGMERDQEIDRGGQGLGAPRPGGPDLRADIFDQGHAGQRFADRLSGAQRKAPRVDQDDGVWLFAQGQGDRVLDAGIDARQGFQPFDQAEDRQLGDVEGALNALFGHARPADADKRPVDTGRLRAQLRHQAGAQGVARGFGGDQHQFAVSLRHR